MYIGMGADPPPPNLIVRGAQIGYHHGVLCALQFVVHTVVIVTVKLVKWLIMHIHDTNGWI